MEKIRKNQDALNIMAITIAVVLLYSLWGAYVLNAQKEAGVASLEVSNSL